MSNSYSIVFVTNNYKPYSGGVVSSIDSLADQMRRQGHQLSIITLDFLGEQQEPETNVIRVPCPIKFLYKTNHMAIPWRAHFNVKKIIEQLKPDIIHTHHPFLLGVSALKTAQELHIPIVFTYHTMYEQYLHYVPLPDTITKPIVSTLAKEFCSAVDGIIVPSNAIKKLSESWQIPKPIRVIPSSIFPIFLSRKVKAKKKDGPFHLLTVSRFAKEKNVPFLLDLFAQLDPDKFTYTLIGYGPEFEYLQTYAYYKLQLSKKRFNIIHKPEKKRLAQAYRDAHLFIFSSTSETQGLVLAESMAAGTPVVTLDGPGQRDIIKQGKNGFIVQNKQEMKTCIEHIVHDKKLYDRLQKNAIKTAQAYAPETIASKLIAFYDSIIKNY